MLKKLMFFILLISVLGACVQPKAEQDTRQQTSNNLNPAITLEEIETYIKEQGLELKDVDLPENNVFIKELNGVSPKAYSLEGTTLSIYIFQSVDDRKAGMEAFEKANANAKLVPYKTFTIKNVLVFYVDGKEAINTKLSSALKS
ncbi:hypothetical protein ACQKP0_21255 [Heyndrickxia sp. NPDC080065]|uniref:hypothetical protein n=1 Tax=Heyndrickxia sp. NPDC080065 TaxID=3390568 RepID=UPI003D08CB39